MGQAEIRRYGGHSAADIERGAQRDEIRRKQERENHRERRCQKRKVRGVGEQDEAAFEQGKGGPCAGNYHLRSSESAGYQSHSLHTENPFPSFASSRPKGCWLAPSTRCGASTSRVYLSGPLERQPRGRLERRGHEMVVALITSLCHHPQSNFLSCLTDPFDALQTTF